MKQLYVYKMKYIEECLWIFKQSLIIETIICKFVIPKIFK